VGCVKERGISVVAEARGKSVRGRENGAAPWFCPLGRAKALCGKEAFLLT